MIVTGGLGPTDSDLTRDVLAAYTGLTLAEHPEVLRQMQQRFGVSRDALRANLRRQTRVPTEGSYLQNSSGTAVGLVFPTERNVIVALPGPPRELQPMVSQQLVPYLSRRFGTKRPGKALTVRFVGIGQSQIEQSLHEHVLLPPGVHVSSQFEGGRVDYTFALPEDTPQAATTLEQLKQRVVQQLGDYVYATDGVSLEEHVLQLLRQRGQTLALVEVATGGALTAGLHRADRSGDALTQAFVAPTVQQLGPSLTPPAATDGLTTTQQLQQIAAAAAPRPAATGPWLSACSPCTTRPAGSHRRAARPRGYIPDAPLRRLHAARSLPSRDPIARSAAASIALNARSTTSTRTAASGTIVVRSPDRTTERGAGRETTAVNISGWRMSLGSNRFCNRSRVSRAPGTLPKVVAWG